MPALPIGTNMIKALDGSKVEVQTWIEAETDKALLLKRKRVFFEGGHSEEAYWFPKSQCHLRKRPIIKLIDGKPEQIGEREELFVPDWLWGKRRSIQ